MTDLDELGQDVAVAMESTADSGAVDRVRARLFDDGVVSAAPRSRTRTRTVAAAVLAAAAMLIAFVTLRGLPDPVGHLASGEALVEGMWLSPAEKPLRLAFEDGSAVDLDPDARGRLVELSAERRRMAIETGRVAVDIVPGSGATWTFEAGPFAVEVLGTAFAVDWDPEEQHMRVDVERGRVRVSGGTLEGEGVQLAAGDRIEADLRDRRTVLSRADVREPPRETPGSASPAIDVDPRAPEPEPATIATPSMPPGDDDDTTAARLPPVKARPSADPKWRALARKGKHREALDAADAAGFDKLLRTANAADLTLLANAARYERKEVRAERALKSLRRRFPKTTSGRRAAFLLGRVAAELGKDPRKAAKWFRTYLAENPSGQMASESRGRLIQALAASGDTSAARRTAADYLARHPKGAYAKIARALVDGGRIE
ncbi:MAG: FecR domain-containing protein [Myxococcota bacterium]